MNELTGRYVNLVLGVADGRGMDFVKHPLQIVANFNSRVLESDICEPEECPIFNTELVWETEKKDLRKTRSSNIPLRVECHTIDANQRKDRIGFVLVNLRSAPVVPKDSNVDVSYRWHKLLGVSHEYKNCHPEIFMLVTIRDHYVQPKVPPGLTYTAEQAVEDQESMAEFGDIVQEAIPIKYLEDGYIQIGSDNDASDTYFLNLTVKCASNLDLLLPEVLVFNESNPTYCISFTMFGITIKSKPFYRDLHKAITLNEKIVVRLLSNFTTLREFFAQYYHVVVHFYCKADRLGMAKLNMQYLIPEVTENDFKIKYNACISLQEKCFLSFPSPHGMVPEGGDGRKPFIDVETLLEWHETLQEPPKEENATFSESSTLVEADMAGGDKLEDRNETENLTIRDSLSTIDEDFRSYSENVHPQTPETNARRDKSPLTIGSSAISTEPSPIILKMYEDNIEADYAKESEEENKLQMQQMLKTFTAPLPLPLRRESGEPVEDTSAAVSEVDQKSEPDYENASEIKAEESALKNAPRVRPISPQLEELTADSQRYEQYCLDIVIENLIWKKQMTKKAFYVKFKHPKAATILPIKADIDICMEDDIILEDIRCKMFFVSTSDQIRKMIYAWPLKIILTDGKQVALSEELELYTAMFLNKSKTECAYTTEFKAPRTFEPVAQINISMYLKEYGLGAFPKWTGFELLPPILDEKIALAELQELLAWKESEKAQFKEDLKMLQTKHVSNLQKEWIKRKNELEDNLCKSIARCKTLTEELQNAANNIRLNKALEKKEREMNKRPHCTFYDEYEKNLKKYGEHANKDLIENISKLERENEQLKDIIKDQRQEIQQMKKTALTKEQTTNLLQQLRGLEEKFHEAQNAKTYFKDQWKRAVREIHDLKSEDYKQIQTQIQNNKEELSQLSLDRFYSESMTTATDLSSEHYSNYGERSYTTLECAPYLPFTK